MNPCDMQSILLELTLCDTLADALAKLATIAMPAAARATIADALDEAFDD